MGITSQARRAAGRLPAEQCSVMHRRRTESATSVSGEWVASRVRRDSPREARFPGLPALRTVRADLPHTALRSVVLPPCGLTGRTIGHRQTEQPKIGEVRVGPAPGREPAAGAVTTLVPLQQEPTQPSSYIAIDRPFTPFSSAVNIRPVQTDASVHAQRARTSPTCLAVPGTAVGGTCGLSDFTNPPSCGPFAPRASPRFLTTTATLDPVRPALRLSSMNTGLSPNRHP